MAFDEICTIMNLQVFPTKGSFLRMDQKNALIVGAIVILAGIFVIGFMMGRQQPKETKLDRFMNRVEDAGHKAKKEVEAIKKEGRSLFER